MVEEVSDEKPRIETNPVNTPKSQELEKQTLDVVLIFGQGPVIESQTRQKASEIGKEAGTEDVNFWSKTLAEAGAELYKRGQTKEIVIMGGKTGGEVYKSESDLILEYLQKFGVPKSAIKLENSSTNTLENLVNVLNQHVDNGGKYKELGILGTNYHLSRIRLLMQLFKIDYKTAFSAEEVLRYVARENDTWDNPKLLELERRLDMNEAGRVPVSKTDSKIPTYYSQKEGTEQKNVLIRGQEEDVWSRALLEVPEYWLDYLSRIDNMTRVREILAGQDSKILQEKFGINLDSDDDNSIKSKLAAIQRIVPNPSLWIEEQWPQKTQNELEELIERRGK